MRSFSDLFDKVLYMFRTCPLSIIRSISTLYKRNRYLSFYAFLFASASVVRMERTPTEQEWQTPTARVQCWDTLDDGHWTCPKHV